MNKYTRYSYFIGGMLASLIIGLCVSSAFATVNEISFNTAEFSINQHLIFKKGETLKTASGATIPSSILYTDAFGEKTHYIPIRRLGEVLNMPVHWDSSISRIDLDVGEDLGLYVLPLNASVIIEGVFKEISPITQNNGREILSHTVHQSTENFETTLNLLPSAGEYVNITTTNTGKFPVRVGLGQKNEDGTILSYTQVPAGETVTRTIQLLAPSDTALAIPYLVIGNPECISRPVQIEVSAVQFSK